MSKTLRFYTNPMSRGRMVRWMLEEVGAPYETEIVAYGEQMKSSPYIDINPMGKVPAIVHGDQIVTECAAICAYLADAFPEAGLAPAMDQRGDYYRWLFFAAGPVEAAVTNQAMKFELSEEQRGMAGYGSLALVTDVLDRQLQSSPYVAGDAFSAADVYVGSQIGWGMQFGTIESRDSFQRYWQQLVARPAHQAANAADDALMPKDKPA